MKTIISLAVAHAYPSPAREASFASMLKAFSSIDALIASLEQGEVDVEAGVPVMRDWDGGWCEIAPALHGWCDCWERIARRMQTDIDLGLLRRMANRLANGMLLNLSDVDRAKAITNRCRALYLACPPAVRESAVLEERIAIAFDEIGLRMAA